MPRSGTTWLARLLASADRAALTGREPMNARGRQYALSGSISGWTRLREPTAAQRRAIKLSHHGLTPLVYSRYGRRQARAALPWTRIIVKDPFAMLSMPALARTSGARPVLVFRHPAAMLASYRRMGWEPDLEELQPLVTAHQREGHSPSLTALDLPAPGQVPEAEAMGRFWAALYTMVLSDLVGDPAVADAAVVSHEELAGGSEANARALFDVLGLRWSLLTSRDLAPGLVTTDHDATDPVGAVPATRVSLESAGPRQLHRLDRAPAEVAHSWRSHVTAEEVACIEAVTGQVYSHLMALRSTVPEGFRR